MGRIIARNMLESLTDRQYQVCLERYGHGRTMRDVGHRLGINVKTVFEHLAAARRRYPALQSATLGRRRTRQLSLGH